MPSFTEDLNPAETAELVRLRNGIRTYPACSGSRGYSNVFGTFLIPSSQTPIAIGVAAHYCEECDDEVLPESVTNITRGDGRYVWDPRPRYGYPNGGHKWVDGKLDRVTRWNLYPCHLEECAAYGCNDFHETVCEECAACGTHCGCEVCESCDTKTSDGICSNCYACESCCECQTCEDCENRVESTTDVNGREVCSRCLDYSYGYCDDCEEYFHHDYSEEHDHSNGCDCVAPNLRFTFPNGDGGTFEQDQRITVELPSGAISREGLNAITDLLVAARLHATDTEWVLDSWDIRRTVSMLDPSWQTKEGNFTKRVAKAFYRDLKCKLPANVISEIGNLASQHTSKQNTFRIELTRDLNQSAEAFYHGDSCWFSSGGYAHSRCALKAWGGIGVRSYRNDDENACYPSGRVWIQPLNASLKPTGDIDNARAYVVYNGYGELDGYNAVRVLAHLLGMTYRKLENLELDPQYVNGNAGYLIADPETCKGTGTVFFAANVHAVQA